MDDKVLLTALNEHQKICFHKSTCEICKPNMSHGLTNCDYCGIVLTYSDFATHYYTFYCMCPKKVPLIICLKCEYNRPRHYNFKHEFTTFGFDGTYYNDCCPLTKSSSRGDSI